ncbi:MAG: terminase family protein [Candidatus Micrarchaeia archaeon]
MSVIAANEVNIRFGVPNEKQMLFMKEKHRIVIFGGARGGGKELHVDTPIPTPDGWVRMGDISPGMEVFGMDGKPYKVLEVSQINEHKAWKFVFDDGSELVSNDEHLWLTYDKSDRVNLVKRTDEYREKRRASRPSRGTGKRPDLAEENATRAYPYLPLPTGSVKTTAEIVATLKVQNGREVNHSIPACAPLQTPQRELPLDPYLLGLWLGDGTGVSGSFTTADGLHRAFEDSGFEVRKWKAKYTYNIIGLVGILRKMGVLGNKHIPDEYLWASPEQRLALIQGMMDTDGNCNKDGGCEFTNTNKALIEGMAHLVKSIGIKCTITEGRATLYGRDCGPKYRIIFMANCAIFRCQRKAERLVMATRFTTKHRYIIEAVDVGVAPMRCITIDSPDHLYLAGNSFIPTHNSWSVRTKAIRLCLKYPGIRVLIVRQSYPELTRNHITQLRRKCYKIAKYSDKEKIMTFFNGSTISFMYCANDADLDPMQGAEYDIEFIDEGTLLTEYQIKALMATNRGVNSFPHRFYITCNPGGQGHGYIKRLIEGRFEGKEDPADYVFIPSRVTDNLVLMRKDPDYIKYLEALPPKIREAWLNGNWDVYLGQFFESFKNIPEQYASRQWTHVIEPFDMSKGEPATWTIYRAHDWGSNAPSATIWFAVDRDGTLYAIMELYTWTGEPNVGIRWTDHQLYGKIHEIETTHPWLKGRHIIGVADPAIWAKKDGTGISTQEVAASYGVHFQKADNNRIPGWMQCQYRLHFNEEGYPGLYIFKNCQNLIRTIPLQMYDLHSVEDLDSDLEDHLADALRYMCMTRPMKPAAIINEKPLLFDPLNQYTRNNPTRRGV